MLHLLHDAERFSALEQIYNKPSHFAGWFLKKIEGNLLLHGSVPAEQNHSSVAAHLGFGASWSVVEQVSKLLECQKHNTERRKAGPMLDPSSITPTFKIRLALITRWPRNNSPDMCTTSCGLLSTKQVVVCSLSPAMMLLLYGQMGNIILAMSMSSSRVASCVLGYAGLHSVTF